MSWLAASDDGRMAPRPLTPAPLAGVARPAEAAPAPQPAVPSIHLDAVSMKFRDGTQALQDLSLRVGVGELVSLVGPSGCGKSTILRLVAGFETPTAGRVTTNGEALGYVFQEATLLPWRSVLDNVELPGQLLGVPSKVRRQRARDAVRRVGLAGFEHHRPAQLSGGMRMRVSIARALTLQPKMFLFDEPFGALDEITRERLNEEVLSLFAAEPFAGLFVTHSVPESVFVSSRVVVLSACPGRIVADIAVPFSFPRAPELRYRPEFAEVAGRVSAALRGGAA